MSAYRRAGHVAWREIAGEFVVVNLIARTMTGLNRAGGYVLELLGAAAAPDALASCFAPAGESLVDRTMALEAFCEELRGLGVVETAEVEGSSARAQAEPAKVGWEPPRVMWNEALTAVVKQSAPPALGDPSCGY